jgi:hypothetical protein
LTIRRADGRTTRVSQESGGSPGFTVKQGAVRGQYVVRYEPRMDEVNFRGQTEAEMLVADESGRTRTFAARFATP